MTDNGDKDDGSFDFVIIGGGIAGVTCVETLATLCPEKKILLITASSLIKAITNFKKVTKNLESFDVTEQSMLALQSKWPSVKIVCAFVSFLDTKHNRLLTSDDMQYRYQRLCLCSGGSAKVIAKDNPFVLGIRDTETVQVFQRRLANARRILLVGNGGIATELVYQIEGCEVVWAIKDGCITSTFVDAAAADFLLSRLNRDKEVSRGPLKREKYTHDIPQVFTHKVADAGAGLAAAGSALGPDWSEGLEIRGNANTSHRVMVEYNVEISQLLTPEQLKTTGGKPDSPFASQSEDDWPVYVELSNGRLYGCDFVVSATGVHPATEIFTQENQFELATDGGIKVNKRMESNIRDVYAAGDVCTASWEHSPHWLQMRLWCQARQTGAYAGQCMHAASSGDHIDLDFCFELFAHVTKFFNYKVVLLGKFNAQGLGNNYELLVRSTPGVEYVKLVLSEDRLFGAVLIGETDLEEVLENLILNQIDLTPFKDSLLDPQIDLEDFFD